MKVQITRIVTKRFFLRPLSESDATETYLSWFGEGTIKKFITSSAEIASLSDLRTYIRARIGRADIVFLGIFDRDNSFHIGNIKYEPVNSELGYAVMGVLIGDPNYRSRGVVPEVLRESARWLKQYRSIDQIVLGVSKGNDAAIKAYEKVGFIKCNTPYIKISSENGEAMVWRIE